MIASSPESLARVWYCMSNDRNLDVLRHMIRYCDEIKDAQDHFGSSLEAVQSNAVYRNAIAMCILQIGELSSHLTDEFKAENDKMPWQRIKGMRNIAAHNYGKFDPSILFVTITERIPELRSYCKEILN